MKYLDLEEISRFPKLLYLQEHVCVASKLQLSLPGRMLEKTQAVQMSFSLVKMRLSPSVELQTT